MNKPLLIIDSPALCHRAKFAMQNIELSFDEMKTEIIFNFLNQILELSIKFETDSFIFAWDSRKSKRAKLYPNYKWKRKEDKTEEEIQFNRMAYEQFHRLRREVLPALGFKNNFIQTGLEADDIIASICEQEYGRHNSVIISRDNDLYQLLDYTDMYDYQTKNTMTLEKFRRKYKTEPVLWGIKVKPIAGCSTDNVGGIEGVAEKTAIKYINGELPEHHKTFKAIESKIGQSIIKRNKPLVHLPFKGTNKFPVIEDKLYSKDFYDTFEKLGFQSLLSQKNFRMWEEAFNLL